MAVSVELRRPLACWPARRSLLGDTGHRLHRLPQDRAGRVVQARSAVQFAGHLQRAFQSAGRPRQAPERPHLDASKKWASLIFPLLERPPTATAGKAMPSTGRSAGRTHSNLLTALMGTRMLQRRWRLPELRWREAEIRQFRMPKIAPLIYDSVFYLFSRNPKSGDVEGPYGTGFIVGRQKEKRGATHYYAVTNWHLACEDGSSILRINTRAGGVRFIETDPSEWEFFAQSDDLAVADITDTVDVNRDEISCIMEEMFVTSDIIKEFDIRGGTDTFMCGLFFLHPGEEDRNVPALRFGNISILASEKGPVEIEATGASCPSHLVDTRSRSGFSGSPVVAYRIAGSDLTMIPTNWFRPQGKQRMTVPYDQFVGLLGVHCGQFWDEIEFRKARKSEKAGDPIKEGDSIEIQSSMTIVVPAWRITDLLDREIFEVARRKRDVAHNAIRARRARPEPGNTGY
jgi:hypothetical protein